MYKINQVLKVYIRCTIFICSSISLLYKAYEPVSRSDKCFTGKDVKHWFKLCWAVVLNGFEAGEEMLGREIRLQPDARSVLQSRFPFWAAGK